MLGRILHLTMYWTKGFAAAGAFARMSSLMLSQPCKISVLSTKKLQPAGESSGEVSLQGGHRHFSFMPDSAGWSSAHALAEKIDSLGSMRETGVAESSQCMQRGMDLLSGWSSNGGRA